MWRRFLIALAGAVLVGVVIGSTQGTAHAQGTSPEQIVPTVFNQYVQDGERFRDLVPGVRVVVTTPDGATVGEGVTGADGKVAIDLPGPGSYVVNLDESTIPAGMAVTDETKTPRDVTVNPNGKPATSFFLGQSRVESVNRWNLLPQTLFNGFKLSSIIAICAMGLSMIYGTTGLSNFAHGEMVTFGALIAYIANIRWGWHVLVCVGVGMLASAAMGAAMERGVWRPLRNRRSSLTSMMIVSIGLALGLRYVYQFFYGARSKAYREYQIQQEWDLGPFSATPRSVVLVSVCIIVIVAVCLYLLKTRFGKAIRAVSDNPELASTSGINTDRVILIVWTMGGALAGLGGVLLGLDTRVQWDMGFLLLLLMFAAITLGGLGNPFGALLGALVIGTFVELWAWVFPNVVELKTIGALAALIVVLLIRPQGILGRKERLG